MAMNLQAVLRIAAQVTGLENLTRLEAGLGKAEAAAQSAKNGFKAMVDSAAWQTAAVGAAALGAGLAASVKAAIDFESSMADVRKVVPGLEDAAGFNAMKQSILDLSKELPVSAEGLAEIMAAAGQAGIAKNDLEDFTRTAAQMGVAFDITAGQAGEAMAKMRTSMGLSQPEVVNLADAINFLSNNMASSASEITDFMLRSGAVGKQVAMTAEQTAALGSAMIAAGAAPEVASTSFNNLIKALTKGETATKRQEGAFNRLGLTARDVAKQMQVDAVGTIRDVFLRISKLPAEVRTATISEVFGDEARALTPLITNMKLFDQAIGSVANSSQYAGSMLSEFEARSGTTANQLQLFKNNMQALAIVVGDTLLPGLNLLAKGLTEILKPITWLVQNVPGLAPVISALSVAFVGFVAVAPFISALITSFAALKGIILAVSAAVSASAFAASIAGWLGAVVPVMAGIIAAFKAMVVAVLAVVTGPVGLTVLLVAGVVALVIAFRKPLLEFVKWLWEWGAPIREFWIGLWEGAKEAAVTVWNGVKAVITGFFSWFAGFLFKAYVQPWITVGTALVNAARSAWDAVKGTVSGFFDWVATGFRQNFLGPITDALNGIRQLFVTAFDAVKSFVSGWFTWWTSLAYQVLIEPFVVLGRQLPGVVQQAWDALSSLFTRYVVEPIKTGWNAAIAFVGSTASQIANLVKTAWQGISSFFQSNVVEPIKSVWQGLQDWMGDIVTRGAEALSRAYQSIAGSVRGAFQGVVNGIGGIINGVIGMINKLIAGVNSLRATVKLSAIPTIPLVTIPSFAVGGVVQRPTLAMVGEGGEREYIVPESKMAAASSRYLAGARGAEVIPTTANSGQATSGGAVPMINISTGPVMEQQGERYVTLGDLESAVKQTATQIYATLRTPAGRRAIGVA
jgi:TP901 family phage tail tape measure protein